DESVCYAIDADQQAGITVFDGQERAALWTEGPESWRDLHPDGYASSGITSVHAGQQGGWVESDSFLMTAAVWQGSSESWINLSPQAGLLARVYGVHDGWQVGTIDHRAALWRGTAE